VTTRTAARTPGGDRARRAREVDIQLIPLDQPAEVVDRLSETLGAGERARASRFAFGHDRVRFIVSRAALRSILGRALGTWPYAVRFAYGSHGKPELAPPFDRAGLTFNLSHSSAFALVAVTRDVRIGVDIERGRPLDDLRALAEQNFSPRERRALLALPDEQREPAFFRCWTRKEAFVKAVGDGLSYPLDRFSVSLRSDEVARLEEIEGDESAARQWTVLDLGMVPGYSAAAVCEGRCARFAWSRWEERVS
jgi:4'-phosphopantetheinyl transferase